MTPDDTRIVLSAMSAMWPGHSLTDDEVALWAHHLDAVDYADAAAVIGVLERTTRFWPHWSEFVAICDPMVRRRSEATRPAIDGGRVCTTEENQAWLARCRSIVANATGPLARDLRRVTGTPPPTAEPKMPDRYAQGCNLASLPKADAGILAATLADPIDRQAFLAGWTSAQEGTA